MLVTLKTSAINPSPTVINTSPPVINASSPPVIAENKIPKKETEVVKTQTNATQPASQAPLKLKGGPSNALLNLAIPGLGHYYVSGDYQGKGRKPVWFAVTALYAGTAGAGIYYMMKSNDQFDQYRALANFREYQHDANGNIIGVRGGNEEEARKYMEAGEAAQKNAKIFLGASAGILAADFVMTLMKGMKNKKEWKKANEKRVSLMFVPGSQITAGVRIKL